MNTDKDKYIQLIMAAQSGDREAFGRLYQEFLTPVYRYVYLRIQHKQIAEEITQEVFLKIYSSISQYENRNLNPLAYFFTAARNAVIDYVRKNKVEIVEIDENIPQENVSEERRIDTTSSSKNIYKFLDKLNEEQKEVVILKYIEDLDTKEIAMLIGKKEDNIRQIQSRALKALRQICKDQGFKI